MRLILKNKIVIYITLFIFALLSFNGSVESKPTRKKRQRSPKPPDALYLSSQTFRKINTKIQHVLVTIQTTQDIPHSQIAFFGKETRHEDDLDIFTPPPVETPESPTILGTGFIFDSDGYIVTPLKAIQNQPKLFVLLPNNDIVSAVIIGTDPRTQIGLIKIDQKNSIALKPGKQGQIGDWVGTVGPSIGNTYSLNMTIISAMPTLFSDIKLIQTNTKSGHNISSTPIVNRHGHLIGVTTDLLSSNKNETVYNFGFPVTYINKIVQSLKENGYVPRGWIGATFQIKNLDNNQNNRVIVDHIIPNTPADISGLQKNDMIKKWENHPIQSLFDLTVQIEMSEIGQTKIIEFQRNDTVLTANISIMGSPNPQKTTLTPNRLGLYLSSKNNTLGITAIEPNSPGDRVGLQIGDIIKEINTLPITTLDAAKDTLNKSRIESNILLLCERNRSPFYVSITLD